MATGNRFGAINLGRPFLFEDFGVARDTLDAMRTIIDTRRGILIVAGKSFDVATGIEALCNLDVLAAHPLVCFSYSGQVGPQDATRIAVGTEADLEPDAALHAARSQAFDAIVLSEVFHIATADLLFDGTGQSAFHAAGLIRVDACAVPAHLLNMGASLVNLQNQLAGILGFRLAHRLCHRCRGRGEPDDTQRRIFLSADRGSAEVYTAPGCDACGYSGTAGEIAVTEWIDVADNVRASMGKGDDAVRDAAFPAGSGTLVDNGFDLVVRGEIAVGEWARVCGLDDLPT